MKKVYKYRNISSINCMITNAPFGIEYSDYPEIEEITRNYNIERNSDYRFFVYCEIQVSTEYKISVSFKDEKIEFHCFNNSNWKVDMYNSGDNYYDVRTGQMVFSENIISFKKYLRENSEYLVPVTFKSIDFGVDLKKLKRMEVYTGWFKKYIEITLYFNDKISNQLKHLKLHFSKKDKEVVDFFIDEINSIQKIITSRQQEEIINRWHE